jgi:trans-aconitate methyltransferase
MELNTAIRLIEQGLVKTSAPQQWADLGAGKGLFTEALTKLLPDNSLIYAIDRSDTLNGFSIPDKKISVQFVQKDFTTEPPTEGMYEGFLLANSLHFVKDKVFLLKQLAERLTSKGRIIIVEYDIDTPNSWIPYPVSFESLVAVGQKAGFTSVDQIGKERSRYQEAGIYSAVLAGAQ